MEEKKIILIILFLFSNYAMAYDEAEVSLGLSSVTINDQVKTTKTSFQITTIEIKKYFFNEKDINIGLSIGGSLFRNETSVKSYLFYPAIFANKYFNKYFSPEASIRIGFSFYEEKNSAASLREDWGRYFGLGIKNYFEVNEDLSLFLSLFYQTQSFNKTSLESTTPSIGLNYSF